MLGIKKIEPLNAIPLICIFLVYTLSRIIFSYVGIRFDATPLTGAWQNIDPVLMKENLFQSLYYLHSQAPAFNAFLGTVVNLFPGNETLVFVAIYLLLGLSLPVSGFLIMTGLGVNRWLSTALVILFTISPPAILYENWLFYTYPIAAFLCVSVFFLHRFLQGQKIIDGLIFFALLAIVALSWSFFHLLWIGVVILSLLLFLFFFDRRKNGGDFKQIRKVLLVSALPFLLTFSLYLKNYITFGSFSASTWMGMNLSRITYAHFPLEERKKLIAEGKISGITLIEPFRDLDSYRDYYAPALLEKWKEVSVLSQKVKAGKEVNFNNIAYIDIAQQYLKDTKYIFSIHPEVYLKGIRQGAYIYVMPASSYSFLKGNAEHISFYQRVYDILFSWSFDAPRFPEGDSIFERSLFVMLMLPLLVVWGLCFSLQALRGKVKTDIALAYTIFFLCLTVVYVSIVGNSADFGENQRFRFVIDPMLLILLGAFLTHSPFGSHILSRVSLLPQFLAGKLDPSAASHKMKREGE